MNPASEKSAVAVTAGPKGTLILSRDGQVLSAREIKKIVTSFNEECFSVSSQCLAVWLEILLPNHQNRFPGTDLVQLMSEGLKYIFYEFGPKMIAGQCPKELIRLLIRYISSHGHLSEAVMESLWTAFSMEECCAFAPTVDVAVLLSDCLDPSHEDKTADYWLQRWNDNQWLERWLHDEPFKTVSNQSLAFSAREALVGHIESCRMTYRISSRTYNSPYCALVQGSGSGKTRLAMECKEDFFVVYISLRKESSREYPLRTTILADYLLRASRKEAHPSSERGDYLQSFFGAILATISSFIAPLVQGTTIRERRRSFFDLVNREKKKEFGEEVKKLMNNKFSMTLRDLNQMITDTLCVLNTEKSRSSSSAPQSAFLFVLDEALELTETGYGESLFFSWRRMIREVTSSDWFFLLLDTSPAVSNFWPAEKLKDRNSRACRGGMNLFPPFYMFPFTGPWELSQECKEVCKPYTHTEEASTELNLAEYTHNAAETLLRNSRLLYSAAATHMETEKLIDFVLSKLLGFDESSPNKNIPLLCYLYSLSPSAQSIKETLISKCSATLLLHTKDQMLVDYAPEPIFGEALMHKISDRAHHFPELLKELSLSLSQGDLERAYSMGDNGAFSAAVYLMEAMRRAAQRRVEGNPSRFLFSTLIPMHEYLSVLAGGRDVLKILDFLFGSSVIKRDAFQRYCWVRCLHSMVSFTRFSQAHSAVTSNELQAALESRIAYFAPLHETVIDAIVPAALREDINFEEGDQFNAFVERLRSKGENELRNEEVEEEHPAGENNKSIAVLAVQVKNLKSHVGVSQARQWLREESSYVLNNTNARFVISILIFTGPGKFTSAHLNGVAPFSILDCRGDADDTDVRSLYVVINEFVAVEEETREQLHQMSTNLNVVAAQQKVYDELAFPESFSKNASSFNTAVLEKMLKTRSGSTNGGANPSQNEINTVDDWGTVSFPFLSKSQSKEKGHLIVPSSFIIPSSPAVAEPKKINLPLRKETRASERMSKNQNLRK